MVETLQNNWTFYLKERKNSKLHKIGTFDSVESFWSYYSYLIPPSKLESGSNYYLFKQDYQPFYDEQPPTGSFHIQCDETSIDYCWQRVIIDMIGENFHNDMIGSCVIKNGENIYSLEVWNKATNNEKIKRRIINHLAKILKIANGTEVEYTLNVDMDLQSQSLKSFYVINDFKSALKL